MATNIITTILLWSSYLFLHSFLASESVKNHAHGLVSKKVYRLIYSIISIVTLLPIFLYLASTPSAFILDKSDLLKYFSLALCTWGIIVTKQSFKHYSLGKFLGFKDENPDEDLVIDGLYRYVRHPLYSGMILISLGFWLYIPNTLNLISIGVIYAYLVIAIPIEEKKLIKLFGKEYVDYKKTTPAVFPDLSRLTDR
ncbi:MAG: isoprenylcysteine carboxylmethyltransferase family protein [Cyclobacteriaceae bacterium]